MRQKGTSSSEAKISSSPVAVAEPDAIWSFSGSPRLCFRLSRARRSDSAEPEKDGPRMETRGSIEAPWRPSIRPMASWKASFWIPRFGVSVIRKTTARLLGWVPRNSMIPGAWGNALPGTASAPVAGSHVRSIR